MRPTLLSFLLILAAAGCVPAATDRLGASSTGPADSALSTSGATSAVRVAVRWPERRTQAIPDDVERIDVAAFKPGGSLLLQGPTLRRELGVVTSEATLSPLPPGEVEIRAKAFDSNSKLLADGKTTVTLRPNEIGTARLALLPVDKPAIQEVTPTSGGRGQVVTITGQNFGATSKYPLEVTIGPDRIPVENLTRQDNRQLSFQIPAGARTGPIVISVGGATASTVAAFPVIATISLSPTATETFTPLGLVDITVTAKDTEGAVVADPYLEWQALKTGCKQQPCAGDTDSIVTDGKAGILVTRGDAGSIDVRVAAGQLEARFTVKTHALGPGDLTGGLGTLAPVAYPPGNGATTARIALGKKLFFDPGLSRSGTMSCATCHDPSKGFADGRRFGLGNDGKDLPRHTPTVLNAAYSSLFFWDGRADSLEAQALEVFLGLKEFDSEQASISAYLQASASYVADFEDAYGAAPDEALARKAIATFERSLVSPATSGFVRWASGDANAMTASQVRGLGAFLGAGRCATCHGGPDLADGKFHNIGVPGSGVLDKGRGPISGNPADQGAFKTPSLHNVALTAPYFHDGSAATLEDATHHYFQFDPSFPNLSPKLRRISLRASEEADLVEFQRALTATPSF